MPVAEVGPVIMRRSVIVSSILMKSIFGPVTEMAAPACADAADAIAMEAVMAKFLSDGMTMSGVLLVCLILLRRSDILMVVGRWCL